MYVGSEPIYNCINLIIALSLLCVLLTSPNQFLSRVFLCTTDFHFYIIITRANLPSPCDACIESLEGREGAYAEKATARAAGAEALTIWTGMQPPKGPALEGLTSLTRQVLAWPAMVPVQVVLAGMLTLKG